MATTGCRVKPPFMERLKSFKSGIGEEVEHQLTELESSEAFDLHFFCSDGIVSTHRLVISNVSKYIMSMLDDQPPWYPTNIHVLDLPKNIVQILVDLAYTGEMRFPEELQSDVFDAMQTLGWIHTDCLSAAYCEDPEHPSLGKDEREGEEKVKNKALQGKETEISLPVAIKTSSRQQSKSKTSLENERVERFSFNEVGDESMEISNLPDISLSDEDEESFTTTTTTRKSTRKVFTGAFDGEKTLSLQSESIVSEAKSNPNTRNTPNTKGRLSMDTNAVDENAQPIMDDRPPKSPGRRSSRRASRRISISESNLEAEEEIDLEASASEKSKALKEEIPDKSRAMKIRRPSLSSVPETETINGSEEVGIPIVEEISQISSASESSSINGSPAKRQRRKPKRFDDMEELPEKTRSSPAKTTKDVKGKRGKKTTEVTPLDTKELPDVIEDGKSFVSTSAEGIQDKIGSLSGLSTPKKLELGTKVPKKTPRKKIEPAGTSQAKTNRDGVLEDSVLSTEVKTYKLETGKATKIPPTHSVSKKKLSGESSKTSLITSYFNKTINSKNEETKLESPVLNRDQSEVLTKAEQIPVPPSGQSVGGESNAKREKKKRTFDQISDAAGNVEVQPSGTEDTSSSRPLRVRKSTRATKSQTESSVTDDRQQDQSPKRKRTKKEESEVVEEIDVQSVETPVRRPSKK